MTENTTTTNTNEVWYSDGGTRLRVFAKMRTLAFAAGALLGYKESDAPHTSAEFMALYETWGKKFANYTCEDDMLKDWASWCDTAQPVIKPAGDVETVGADLSVQYGAITMTFSVRRDFEISSDAQRAAVSEWLSGEVFRLMDLWHKKNSGSAPNVPNHMGPSQGNGTPSASSDVINVPVSKVVVSLDGGKKVFKCMGGEYQKWGVSAYKDTCKVTGDFNPFTSEPGEYPVSGMMAVQMQGGKPKRVIHLAVS